jgi:polyhydroxybutyrate depolymerase
MKRIMSPLIILMYGLFLITCSDDPTAEQQRRFEATIDVGGRTRNYVINLPPAYHRDKAQRFALVLALHGTAGSAQQMEQTYGLNEKGAEAGFIVVYPEGIRGKGALGIRSWNAGRCCDEAMESNVDDVGFISAVIDRMIIDFRADPKRVYVTGMSNGGMMAYRLACELFQKIVAIAPVSSTMMVRNCEPGRAVPVLHMHSLLDTKVPYGGGVGIGGYFFTPVDSALNVFAINGNCAETPVKIDNGRYIQSRWSDCNENVSVENYITYDGGHSWPGGTQPAAWADLPSVHIKANDLLWEFFQRFELPQ